MSFSSSMTRICLGGILLFLVPVRHRCKQGKDAAFKIGDAAAALGQKLCGAEAETRLIGTSDIQRRVDEKRDLVQRRAFAERANDREAVDVGKAEIQDDQTRRMES